MNYSFLEEEKESIISNDLVKNENNELDEGLKDIFRKVTKSVKDASPISTLRYAFGSDDASVIENEIYKNAKQLNSILQSNEETSKLITDALSNYYHITDQITRIARICNKIIENREDEQLFAEGVREIAKAINNIEHMGGMHGAKDVSDLTTFYKNAMNDIMNGMGKSQFKKVQSLLASLKDNVKTLLKKNNSSSQRSNNINNNSKDSDSSFDNIGNDPSLNYDPDDSVDLDDFDDFDDFDDAPVDNGVLNNGVSGQAQQGKQRSMGSDAKLATTGNSSGNGQTQQGKQRPNGSDAKLATTGSSSGSGQAQQNKQKNVDPYAQTLQLNAISKDNSDNSTSRKSAQVKRVSSDKSDKSTSRNSTHVKRVSSDMQDKSTSTKSTHVKHVSNDVQDKSTGRNSTQSKDISKDKKGNEVFKNQVKSAENNKETKRQDALNKEDNSNNDIKQHNKGNETKDNPEKNKKTGEQKSVSNNKSGDSDKLINYLKAHPVLKIAETN